MDEEKEPTFEAEDIGCQCNEDCDDEEGYDSEWEWTPSQGCYVCTGCGDIQ
jgi:hypothetical protein